jgi:DNA-binding GntR family transcriptional regulator
MIDAMKQITRPKSLFEMAADYIRRAITKGDLKLGQPISEGTLASSLGISKTPVREALAKLKMEGLVQVVPQKGTFVFTLTEKEVIGICELRYTLESTAVAFAFDRNREPFLAAERKTVDGMRSAKIEDDEERYLELDSAFHMHFFNYCGNHYLDDAYQLIAARVAAMRTHLSLVPGHTTKSFKEHIDILQCISNNDVAKALKILDEHITRTKNSAAIHFPKYNV